MLARFTLQTVSPPRMPSDPAPIFRTIICLHAVKKL
jgi:hypothetical protein